MFLVLYFKTKIDSKKMKKVLVSVDDVPNQEFTKKIFKKYRLEFSFKSQESL